MNFDAELFFECLIYFNAYFFAMFAFNETLLTSAKFVSHYVYANLINDLYRDVSVVAGVLLAEFFKILFFNKYKKKHRSMMMRESVGMAVGFIWLIVFFQFQ